MEKKSEPVFVDSNYFIALFNKGDALHEVAGIAGKALVKSRARLVISNLIFSEIVTVLSMKVGRQAATEAGEYLSSSTQVQTVFIDDMLHKASWEVFQEVKDKNVSFVDCSIVAAMHAYDIGRLLTFDKKDFQRLQKKYRIHLYSI